MITIYALSLIATGLIAAKVKIYSLAITYLFAGSLTLLALYFLGGSLMEHWWFTQPMIFLNIVTGYQLYVRFRS